MSQFTAELSQLAGIEGSTEDIARDIAPTTPAHPPRAARRETLDVSLDHNIDIDAAREELARRRRAQALASMTDAELQRLLDAGSDPQPVAPAASPADASQVSPIGSNNVAVSVADTAAFPAFGPGMPDASMYASPAGDPMTAAPVDQGPLLPLAMSVANIEDPATPVASGAHMGPASNLLDAGVGPHHLLQVIQQQQRMMQQMQQMTETIVQTSTADSRRPSLDPTVVTVKADDNMKLPQFKNADQDTTVIKILNEFETYFKARGISPSVPVFLRGITEGGNLKSWTMSHTPEHGNASEDPENILNWTWDRLKDEIVNSTLYRPVDLEESLKSYLRLECAASASLDEIRVYVNVFDGTLNKGRADGLPAEVTNSVVAASLLWISLPQAFQALMSQFFNSTETIRTDYAKLKKDINEVLKWPYCKKTYQQLLVTQAQVVKANAAPTLLASQGPAGPRTAKRGNIGAPGDYIAIIDVKVQGHEQGIDAFIANLCAQDSRFQGKLNARGNKIILTHPAQNALDGIGNNRHLLPIKPFIGEIKKATKIKSPDAKPPQIANPAPAVSADALQALQDEITSLKKQLESRQSQASTLERADTAGITANAAKTGIDPATHHMEHPTMLEDSGGPR